MKRLLRAPVLAIVAVLVVASAASAVTKRTSRTEVAPSNSSLPTISGNLVEGSTVTANPGTWNGSTPITFQYQWRICDASGGACHAIGGATSQTYQIRSGDQGNTLRVRVIGSNSEGSATATSAPTRTIAPGATAPANTTPPTISGNATVGSTLTANNGSWSGQTPISYAYQWRICDANGNACHDIGGANGSTYQVRSGDQGNTIRVVVTAKNAGGDTSSTTVPTAKVGVAAPPAPPGCPKLAAGAQSVAVADVAAPARLQVDRFVGNGPITSGMTSFSVRFHISDTCGQPVSGALVYVTAVPYNQVSIPAEAATDGSGWVTLTFNRLRGFPAAQHQQLMVLFVRARKPGDSLLAGISTRRLISLPVHLNR